MDQKQQSDQTSNLKMFTLKVQQTPLQDKNLRLITIKEYATSRTASTYFTQNNLMKQDSKLFQISKNSFFDAFYAAYILHGDVMISASDIWLTICHKFAAEINKDAEKYRHLFVSHEGKKELTIYLNGLSQDWKDFPCQNNRWDKAMELFSVEISKNTKGDIAQLIKNDFSSTNWIEKASSNICLMSQMQNYFDYKMMMCGCGIQNVHFVGGIEDFEHLAAKISTLKQNYQLNNYFTNYLSNVLKIVNTFISQMQNPNQPDIAKFWNSIFEETSVPKYGLSGIRQGEQISFRGWFRHFFNADQILKDEVPQFASQAPVKASDQIKNKSYNLTFITKMEGIEEIEPNVFRPNINISVLDADQTKQKTQQFW
ncbi:hypothetical protein TTHERM_01034410 (macronuclear) [Tetrahymena thermophila SB210]|uniref:Uncharacterized protein n=1 Tax=Tetrahymena thermophila (strain SB210) TaxID=312017 RepID=Q235I8_TETTS|nr:hypothetical protein TTHERM_01034410 [Tetrahymena thermophila SB210]EAR92213.1 hypothetical protein TTHERM_01034410 [Tetrahymena thermophila SB210]|eukprot:XP_001012458.1 hypothetical protein TTHERM_01034410 [Tetrahymena thermophila SB210]